MDESVIPKTTTRSLRVDLNAKEIHEMSLQLATETKRIVSLEEEKKSVMSQYKAKLDEATATANKLSNLITDGFEFRDVECEIEYNKPEIGKKTLIRKDIDKVHAIEKMDEWEHNLFNQPEDEETSDLLQAERNKLTGGRGRNGKRVRKDLE